MVCPTSSLRYLSPSSQTYDRRIKLDAYFRAGVPEYWIVDPEARTVTIHVRRRETFAPVELGEDEEFRSEVLPEFRATIAALFVR